MTSQVCVPFLLLCLGLDPKTETTKFMSRFQTFNTRTVAKETLSETETEAPKEKENVSKETPPVKSAVSAENSEVCGCGQICCVFNSSFFTL